MAASLIILISLFLLILCAYYIKRAHVKREYRIKSPFGIDELKQVRLGGVNQWIWTRAEDSAKPILLFIHGGPGKAEMSFLYKYQTLLETEFIVVHWDQRGAGKSYSNKIHRETICVDQILADMEELIKLLKAKHRQEKILLLGHSWGSALGMWAVKRFPQHIEAYIGMGQVSHYIQSQIRTYSYCLAQANSRKDSRAIRNLQQIGSPPYNLDLSKSYILFKYTLKFGAELYQQSSYRKSITDMLLFPGYNLFDLFVKWPKGHMFVVKQLIADVENIDLYTQVPEVQVPVFFFLGRHDHNTSSVLAENYFQTLKSPSKKIVWFENSAHSPMMEEPVLFQQKLIQTILEHRNSVS